MIASAIASPSVPVTASFLCWGAADGVADDVADGVALGVGVGDVDGVADGLGSGVVDGLGDADGAGVGVTGVGVGLGVGAGVGVGVGLGAGVGVGVNPALPPDSRRTTRVLTSQDLSWEVMVAESLHGPGSAASTPTFSWSRAFSPVLSVTLSVALLLSQLTTVGSWNRSYIGWPQGPAEWYTPTRPTSRSLHTNC